MSVDLAIWEGPRPVDDADAVATFDRLCEEFLDQGTGARPTDAITDYVMTLLGRYPDLPDEGTRRVSRFRG